MRKFLIILYFIIPVLFYGQTDPLSFLETSFFTPYIIAGNQYYSQNDYDSALLMYSASYLLGCGKFPAQMANVRDSQRCSLIKRNLWGYLNLRLGQIYYYQGNALNSIRHLYVSELIFSNSDESVSDLAKCYYFLGLSYSIEHNYSNSLIYYYKSLKALTSLGIEESNEAGYIYLNIGNVYGYQGKYQKAIDYYNKSLVLLQNQDSIKEEKISIIINNLGSIYYALGDISKAKEYYLNAIVILGRVQTKPNSDLSMYYNNLAGLFSYEEEYDSAELFYQKSLKIRNEILPRNHINKSQTYLQLGIVSYYKGDYYLALQRVEKSIAQNSYTTYTHYQYSERLFSNVIDYNLMASSLCLRAQIYQSLSFQNGGVKLYSKAVNAFDSLLSFTSYYLRYGINNERYWVYSDILRDGINSALGFYSSNNPNIKNNKEKLFQFIEYGKSVKLLKIMVESKAKVFANIPNSSIKKEIRLRQGIIDMDITLSKARANNIDLNSPIKYLELIEKRAGLQIKLDSLIQFFEHNFDGYYDLKYNNSIVEINSLQGSLPDSTAIIEYYCGDSNVYIVFISNSIFEIHQSPIDSIITTINRHLRNITFCDNFSLLKSGSDLYRYLLLDFEEYLQCINKIIFIPDEYLFHIPFESIICNYPTDFQSPRFLLYDYEICYQYSSSIWKLTHSNNHINETPNKSFLGLAPYTISRNREHEKNPQISLPFSNEEVSHIGRQFDMCGYNSLILYDSCATKDNFTKHSPDFTHIHLATHGYYNSQNPELSMILLGHNNKLYIGDSYNLNLNADLVALSSCKSGVGGLMKGEGLISMTRGFFYSGARNVLYSIWNVQDQSTSLLFKVFYTLLFEGNSPSMALQKAKIQLLSNPGTSLPVFWSGFLLLGN